MSAQCHAGEDVETLTARHRFYLNAKLENAMRWSDETRNRKLIKEVHLNSEKSEIEATVGQVV